jgi:D-3-phosphoglycerate dehydrogenase / 2-oxoglutarate reductase
VSADRYRELGVEKADNSDGVYAVADFLTLHLPKTPETEGWLDAEALAKCKDGVKVLNVARGPLINDDDLIAALDSGQIVAATLDVFRQEPLPKEHPFWRHPRITVIPHASRGQFPGEITPLICAHLRRFQRGEPLTDRVDIAAGY